MSTILIRVTASSATEVARIMEVVADVAVQFGAQIRADSPLEEDDERHLFDGGELLTAVLAGLTNIAAGLVANAIHAALVERLSRPQARVLRRGDATRAEIRDEDSGAQVIVEQQEDELREEP